MNYQDKWVKGVSIHGVRECESRYAVIKELLPKDKPFTLLDLGANLGYFSFRIAFDFPQAVCVMVEDSEADQLLKLAHLNALPNVVVLKQRLTVENITRMAECEIFDFVLALNIAHHVGSNSLAAMEQLGRVLVVETPNPKDEGSCGKEHLSEIHKRVSGYKKLGEFSRHTSNHLSLLGVKEFKKSVLKRKYWDAELNWQTDGISQVNGIFRKGQEKRGWICGINYRTFEYMGGIYPHANHIKSKLHRLDYSAHSDLQPWNIIISGQELHLIDANDVRANHNASRQMAKIRQNVGRLRDVKYYCS